MLRLGEISLLISTLAVTMAVVVPFSGVLVRFRANYNPKRVALDIEGNATPHTGPVIRSYFAMMKRVYQIEVCSPCSARLLCILSIAFYARRAGQGFTKELVSQGVVWQ